MLISSELFLYSIIFLVSLLINGRSIFFELNLSKKLEIFLLLFFHNNQKNNNLLLEKKILKVLVNKINILFL